MIKRSEIQKIVSNYDGLRIGVLGSHSALEVMDGAKDEDLETIVFCQKGRETPYQRFSRIANEIIILKKFNDIASAKKFLFCYNDLQLGGSGPIEFEREGVDRFLTLSLKRIFSKDE